MSDAELSVMGDAELSITSHHEIQRLWTLIDESDLAHNGAIWKLFPGSPSVFTVATYVKQIDSILGPEIEILLSMLSISEFYDYKYNH